MGPPVTLEGTETGSTRGRDILLKISCEMAAPDHLSFTSSFLFSSLFIPFPLRLLLCEKWTITHRYRGTRLNNFLHKMFDHSSTFFFYL